MSAELQRKYGVGRRVAQRLARAGLRLIPNGSFYVQHGDENYLMDGDELHDFLEQTRGTQVRVHRLKEEA